jgi:hypothetical protein
MPATPAIDRFLARAVDRRAAHADPVAAMLHAFGVSAPAGMDFPSAPICLLADDPDRASEGYWFHADPAYLRADRDQVLLFAGPSLDLRRGEADALVQVFNSHFAADGLELIAPHPARWYLRVTSPPSLMTCPIHAVNRRPINSYLPSGSDARRWIAWINEAQMLFHGHPVNLAREREGRPTIGGIWPWGGATLPSVSGGPALVVGDHVLSVGLARAANSRLMPLDSAGELMALDLPESTLIFWDRLWCSLEDDDSGSWLDALPGLETLVVALGRALAARHMTQLVLTVGGDRFELTRADTYKFWRRRGKLEKRLDSIGT